jgi:hypothetical protein
MFIVSYDRTKLRDVLDYSWILSGVEGIDVVDEEIGCLGSDVQARLEDAWPCGSAKERSVGGRGMNDGRVG